MKCRDASNYTQDQIEALMAQWYAEGDRSVILQAFPPSYHQYQEQRRQMAAATALGMALDIYVYDYLGDPTWLHAALDGIATARVRTVWLDEEDVETERGWTPARRVAAIHASVGDVQDRGHRVGIYTASWWWVPLTANCTDFAGLPLWFADYTRDSNNNPLPGRFIPFGGWTSWAIHQYEGTQRDGTDLNVLSADEEALVLAWITPPDSDVLAPVIPPVVPVEAVDEAWLLKKDRAVSAAGRQLERAAQMEAECSRRRPRKTVIRTIAAGVRSDAQEILQ